MKFNLTHLAVAAAVALSAVSAGSASAGVINPGFEANLSGWTTQGSSDFTKTGRFAITEGTRSVEIFNRNNATVSPGEYGAIAQNVDLTFLSSITFDLQANYNGGPTWKADRFVGSFTIDGIDLVTFDTEALFLDVTVDLSGYTGIHEIGFRLTSIMTTVGTGATGSGAVTHAITMDNIRTAVPEPGALATLGLGLVALGALRRRRRTAA